MGHHPWAFSFFRASLLAAALTLTFLPPHSHAADPPVNSGAPTYVPPAASGSPAVTSQARSQGVNLPGAGPTNVGTIPTPDTIPPPTGTSTTVSLGQYRNQKQEVKLEKMLLDRYQSSVVSVSAKDFSGNEISRAMGVGVGRNAQFIATSLSLLLGNDQQWADEIEITHAAGNKYKAKVALIDEEKNLVLLAPEAAPAPLPFVREVDERPQLTVFTISFEKRGQAITSRIHRGVLAAVNRDTGLLSAAPAPGEEIGNDQAGTAILSSIGELVGMLLPDQRGVLASTIQNLVLKAQKATPIEPYRIGVILGRGVLVGGKEEGSFPTITAALEAIRKGDAPKTDPSLYTPARSRAVAPKEADKVVIKVMPGTYKEAKTISLPANLSLAGSGPDRTNLVGTDPAKPVVLVQDVENAAIVNLRLTPAPKQSMKAPTVIVNKSRGVSLAGNVIEARGGVGLWLNDAKNVTMNANAFPESKTRAVSCEGSSVRGEANAFVGTWPAGFVADRGCSAELSRSLFFANEVGVMIGADAGAVSLKRNTFVRSSTGVRVGGKFSRLEMGDNLFFECESGLSSSANLNPTNLGRNGIWKSKFTSQGKNLGNVDLVRTEPHFIAPANYDFRLEPGQGQLSTAILEPGSDLGAYQFEGFLGPYTQPLARSLGVAVGTPSLPKIWGLVQ